MGLTGGANSWEKVHAPSSFPRSSSSDRAVLCPEVGARRIHMRMAFSLDEIRRLPVADRLKLVEEIWDSIVESAADPAITESQRVELRRRLQEFARDPRSVRSWEDVRKSFG